MATTIRLNTIPRIVRIDLRNPFARKVDPTTARQRLQGAFDYLNELYVAMGEPIDVVEWQREAMLVSLRTYLNQNRLYEGHVVAPTPRNLRGVLLNGEFLASYVMYEWFKAHVAIKMGEPGWEKRADPQDPRIPHFKVVDPEDVAKGDET